MCSTRATVTPRAPSPLPAPPTAGALSATAHALSLAPCLCATPRDSETGASAPDGLWGQEPRENSVQPSLGALVVRTGLCLALILKKRESESVSC